MRNWLAAILCLVALPALAQTGTQKTPAQIAAETNSLLADNTTNSITAANFRQVFLDTAASYAPLPNRTFLTANTDYFVRTDGNDACNGTVNSAGTSGNCAFLTVQRCLSVVSLTLDLSGKTVRCRVQGGSYSGHVTVPAWVGYDPALGFSQFSVIGENGTVTLSSPDAAATIFSTKSTSPVRFFNLTVTNATASGLAIQADDYGFIALDTITLSGTGAGGIVLQSLLFSNILIMSSTISISGGGGTFAYPHNSGIITTQPGVVFNLPGAAAYTNAMADVDATGAFHNTGSSFTGTVPTAAPYKLVVPGTIDDVSLIAGSGASVVTPLTTGRGGTGVALPAAILGGSVTGVNLNTTNTDTAIPITSPTTNYKIEKVTVFNTGTTASLTTATAGLFTAAGGGGLALAANQALAAITSNAINTDTNSLDLTITVGARTTINSATLQFRNGTAQGAAAAGSVYVWIRPQP